MQCPCKQQTKSLYIWCKDLSSEQHSTGRKKIGTKILTHENIVLRKVRTPLLGPGRRVRERRELFFFLGSISGCPVMQEQRQHLFRYIVFFISPSTANVVSKINVFWYIYFLSSVPCSSKAVFKFPCSLATKTTTTSTRKIIIINVFRSDLSFC